ncbi:MAG: O-antigen ligase family protein [Endomicrobia bacterium]|nr:O-antigen ligase family protein [Endomicrobiia bacterium]MCL2799551.1 O-antigen ligase family protein [Endomicrobiia bacterium]
MEKLNILGELKKNDLSFYCLLIVLVISLGGGFVFSFTAQVVCFILLSLSFSIVFVRKSFEPKNALIVLLPLVAAAVSYFSADFQANVRISLLTMLNATIAFFAALYADERNRENILITLAALGVWVAVMMFASLASGNPDEEKNFSLNANIAAGFLLLVYPLNFGFVEKNKNPKIFLIAAFVIFAAILASKSIFDAALAYFVAVFYFVKLKKNISLKIFFFATTAVFMAGLFYAVHSKTGWSSFSDKLLWWKTAIIIFKAHPFFGAGFGNFSALHLFYRPELTLNTMFAHNIAVQLLAETGIFGFAAFTAAAFAVTKNIFNRIKIKDKEQPYIKAAFISAVVFICLNLIDYNFFIPANMLVFYVIAGTAFTVTIAERKTRIPALLIFIPVLCFIYIFASLVIAQNYYEEGDFLREQGKYEQAVQMYEKATISDKKNPVYWNALSEYLYFLSTKQTDPEQKRMYLQKAVDSSLKAEQYYYHSAGIKGGLAWLYRESGDETKAKEYAELARSYDKFNQFMRKTAAE